MIKSILKAIISAILSVILMFMGIDASRSHLPEKGSLANQDSSMTRIMSFNIRCGEYLERENIVSSLIDAYQPDSVGIQECTFDWYLNLKWYLDDYAFVGVGRDTGKLGVNCGEISAVLYKKDKFKLIDSGTFWLSETPDKVSLGWDGACNRICTWVVLEDKETGDQYAHVNTHLDHVGPLARTNGVELVKEKALSFDIPTVVTGDFNFKKSTDLYTSLVTGGLTDTQDMAEYTMTGKTYHGYEGGTEGEPIDFICVNSLITEVQTYKIVRDTYAGRYTSDHYPIYSDMVIY